MRFDSAAVSQAVINLLDNAAKYSGTARTIDIRLDSRNGDVTFEVQDQGIGIAAEDRDLKRRLRSRDDAIGAVDGDADVVRLRERGGR